MVWFDVSETYRLPELSSDTKVDPRDDTNIDPLVDVNPMGCPERRP
jgi:hypothetical protein